MCVAVVEVINIRTYCCRMSKLHNEYTIERGRGEEHLHLEMKNSLFQN